MSYHYIIEFTARQAGRHATLVYFITFIAVARDSGRLLCFGRVIFYRQHCVQCKAPKVHSSVPNFTSIGATIRA